MGPLAFLGSAALRALVQSSGTRQIPHGGRHNLLAGGYWMVESLVLAHILTSLTFVGGSRFHHLFAVSAVGLNLGSQ